MNEMTFDDIKAKRTEEVDDLLKRLSKLLYNPDYAKNAKDDEDDMYCGVDIVGELTVADAIVTMLTVAKPKFRMETAGTDIVKATFEAGIEIDEDDDNEEPYLVIDSGTHVSFGSSPDEDDDDDYDDEDFGFPIVDAPDDPEFLAKLGLFDYEDVVTYYRENTETESVIGATVNLIISPDGNHIVISYDQLPEDLLDEEPELKAACSMFVSPDGLHYVMVPLNWTRELHLSLREDVTSELTDAFQTIKDSIDDVKAIDSWFGNIYAKLGTDPSEIPSEIMCQGDDTILVSGELTIGEDLENESSVFVPVITATHHQIENGNSVELKIGTGIFRPEDIEETENETNETEENNNG